MNFFVHIIFNSMINIKRELNNKIAVYQVLVQSDIYKQDKQNTDKTDTTHIQNGLLFAVTNNNIPYF